MRIRTLFHVGGQSLVYFIKKGAKGEEKFRKCKGKEGRFRKRTSRKTVVGNRKVAFGIKGPIA